MHTWATSGDRAAKEAAGQASNRNGSYPKTVDSAYGPVDIQCPRSRGEGTCIANAHGPQGQHELTDLDDMIISLYAGGMTVRDIEHHLATTHRRELVAGYHWRGHRCGLEVTAWQTRQLDEFYPVIFLDALRVKIRDNGRRQQGGLHGCRCGVWKASSTSWACG